MMSSRIPVFRAFPREGIPPHYGTWEIYSHRVGQMIRGGAIEDYTYLWWDVRPHPKLGTVETRICDQQTSLESTLALAALIVSLARRLSKLYDSEEPLVEYPTELIDDNKVRAAVRGMEGELVDFRAGHRCRRPSSRSGCSRSLRTMRTSSAARITSRRSGRSSGTGPARGDSSRPGKRRKDLKDVVRGLVIADA